MKGSKVEDKFQIGKKQHTVSIQKRVTIKLYKLN